MLQVIHDRRKQLVSALLLGVLCFSLVSCGRLTEQPRLLRVEVPGEVYGFIWPEAPPYAVDYVPGSAFTLTFDRQLAPEQDLELFYIQQGSYVPIHPAGSRDPYFGGQPQDVYRIRGNQLRIWAASGGLPMGTAMVVLPAGLKAADGSVLKEDVSFLVSQARPSPLAQVRDLVVDHDTSEKPLLRLLSEQGGPPIGYAVRDSVAVVDQPDGRVIRVLQHMDTFVIEGDQHHGWQRVTYYTRAPEALQSSVPLGATVFNTPALATPHTGWVRSDQIGTVPQPEAPGVAVTVRLSTLFSENAGHFEPAVQVFVPPTWPWTERWAGGVLTSDHVAALAFRTAPLWAGSVGVRYHAQTVTINGETLDITDPRAHPALTGMSPEQWQKFRDKRREYVDVVLGLLEQVPVPEEVRTFRDREIIRRVRYLAAIEDAMLDWIRHDEMRSVTQLVERVAALDLDPPLDVDRAVDRLHAEPFLTVWPWILAHYSVPFYETQTAFTLLWRSGSLDFAGPVEIRQHFGSNAYEGYSPDHGLVWLLFDGSLSPDQTYQVRGALELQNPWETAEIFLDPDMPITHPIIKVTEVSP